MCRPMAWWTTPSAVAWAEQAEHADVSWAARGFSVFGQRFREFLSFFLSV
jgi:hypothetical protein